MIAVDVRTVAWVALATLAAVLAVMWADYYATDRDDQAQTVETLQAVDDLLDRELSTITPAPPATELAPTSTEPAYRPAAEWSRETLEGLVRTVFPEDPDTAVRIVTAESGWNPRAVSSTDDHGLFQINGVHLRPLGVAWGYSRTDLLDPLVNLRVARAVYDEAGGWTPWTTY